MKKTLFPTIAVMVFITLVGLLQRNYQGSFNNPLGKETASPIPILEQQVISVAGNSINAEIAKNAEERRKGLSGRDSLQEGTGMLFVFDQGERPTFWMKDMAFAIDIIWVADGKIVGVEKNVQPEPGTPEEELFLYPAPQPIDYVLEVSAGYSDKYSLKRGDVVDLSGVN